MIMSKGRKMRQFLSVVVLAAGLLLAGCGGEEVVQEEYATPVAVEKAVTGSLTGNNEMTGEVTPGTDLDLVPKAQGEITHIYVQKGEQVTKGQEIARIDDKDQRRSLENDEATLKQAQSGLERAKNGLAAAQSNYDQAAISKKQAEANKKDALENRDNSIKNLEIELTNIKDQWETAQKNLERMEALFEDGLISQVELEEAKSGEARAANGYKQTELQLNQAKSNTSVESVNLSIEQAASSVKAAETQKKDAQIAVEDAQINVEKAQIAVDAAKDRLADYVIKAPANGEIVSLNAEVGELVSNQGPFARLITVDYVKVSALVSAQQLMLFEMDDLVTVDLAGLEEPKQGRVTYIAPTSGDTGLFTVEVQVNNEDAQIRPGMVATLNVEEVFIEDSMIVPTAAIVEKQEQTYVFVVNGDRVERRDVEVIRYDTDYSAITGEVAEGDRLVTKGQNLVSDGDLVKIVEGDN